MTEDSEVGIRVVCRFRPFNKRELGEVVAEQDKFRIKYSDEQSVSITTPDGTKNFSFDRIFPPETKQIELFQDTGRPTVNEIMKGFNGTLFAYGQTGAGKSFSMFGPDIAEDDLQGIIPRSAQMIFETINKDTTETEFVAKCSFLEIYNEQIRDLFNPAQNNLQVRESPTRGIYVGDATEISVSTEEEVSRLLQIGEQARSVSFTQMNAKSSRSHSVFVLQISQKTSDGSTKAGKLNLVDLAGSEKVKKTNATGQTLNEAKKINQSLSALGMCIHALVEGSAHVPFRDSKLTRILQESLGGNCKTTLLICASAHPFNAEETISTLMFGQRAKCVKNQVKCNAQLSVAELTKRIDAAKLEISRLKNEISAYSFKTQWMRDHTDDWFGKGVPAEIQTQFETMLQAVGEEGEEEESNTTQKKPSGESRASGKAAPKTKEAPQTGRTGRAEKEEVEDLSEAVLAVKLWMERTSEALTEKGEDILSLAQQANRQQSERTMLQLRADDAFYTDITADGRTRIQKKKAEREGLSEEVNALKQQHADLSGAYVELEKEKRKLTLLNDEVGVRVKELEKQVEKHAITRQTLVGSDSDDEDSEAEQGVISVMAQMTSGVEEQRKLTEAEQTAMLAIAKAENELKLKEDLHLKRTKELTSAKLALKREELQVEENEALLKQMVAMKVATILKFEEFGDELETIRKMTLVDPVSNFDEINVDAELEEIADLAANEEALHDLFVSIANSAPPLVPPSQPIPTPNTEQDVWNAEKAGLAEQMGGDADETAVLIEQADEAVAEMDDALAAIAEELRTVDASRRTARLRLEQAKHKLHTVQTSMDALALVSNCAESGRKRDKRKMAEKEEKWDGLSDEERELIAEEAEREAENAVMLLEDQQNEATRLKAELLKAMGMAEIGAQEAIKDAKHPMLEVINEDEEPVSPQPCEDGNEDVFPAQQVEREGPHPAVPPLVRAASRSAVVSHAGSSSRLSTLSGRSQLHKLRAEREQFVVLFQELHAQTNNILFQQEMERQQLLSELADLEAEEMQLRTNSAEMDASIAAGAEHVERLEAELAVLLSERATIEKGLSEASKTERHSKLVQLSQQIESLRPAIRKLEGEKTKQLLLLEQQEEEQERVIGEAAKSLIAVPKTRVINPIKRVSRNNPPIAH
ncbi:putative Kinesin heavy chain [Blattamonas nauphoetae]|uniref:Kinesin heavy chain n=1 Tax=Blattamonas nauphoetae TaxID=2049346 RepID=A0ABQ9Y6H5_9EUKA|nr:putative Kinesin heavy chain [Blattamonas nauphoetae]